MKEQPKVSIVVPIYNVERYIRQCVDSILAQTLQEIEVILVDDGSPDNCPRIVDEYAEKDVRVKAIHQPNGGYGRAVNHGISVATAPYIGIIESDDWIEPNMYELLYQRAVETDSEVVKAQFYRYDSTKPKGKQDVLWETDEQSLMSAPDGVFCPLDFEPLFHFHASLWSNLYRADLLRSVPLLETSGASYQDFPFIMEILGRTKRMSVVKVPLLHYRMEDGQNSSTMCRSIKLIQMPRMATVAREKLMECNAYDKVKESYYFHAFLACFGFLFCIEKRHQKAYFKEFHKLMAPMLKHPDISFRYFRPDQAKFAKAIAAGKYGEVCGMCNLFFKQTQWKKSFRFFGIPIFSINRKKGKQIYRLLGIRLWKSRYGEQK